MASRITLEFEDDDYADMLATDVYLDKSIRVLIEDVDDDPMIVWCKVVSVEKVN